LIAGARNLAILSSLKMKLLIPVVLILVASGIFYALTLSKIPTAGDSSYETLNLQSLSSFRKVSKPATQLESVDILLIKLKKRLEREPDDADGWLLLSKSYYHLNRLNEANEVFEKAKSLGYNGNWEP